MIEISQRIQRIVIPKGVVSFLSIFYTSLTVGRENRNSRENRSNEEEGPLISQFPNLLSPFSTVPFD